MMSAFRQWRDRMLGRGDAACTVPVFDGPLQPNQAIEQAEVVYQATDPWDLASDGQQVWLADGPRIIQLDTNTTVVEADGKITALCAYAGGIAYAVNGGKILVAGGRFNGHIWANLDGKPLRGINALAADGDDLIATEGSREHDALAWQHDLMHKGHSGRVIRLRGQDQSTQVLASGLHHAFGVVVHGSAYWVSESWQHRVVALGAGDRPTPVIDQLPGYPSRLAPASDGGWWLSVFACRTQLVELVLREEAYRTRMIASIPPELWVAPQLRSGQSFLEPLQGGGIKQMGVLKPWAPPRSYGLVIKLDAAGHPVSSLHSRVDGHHHGIVAIAECGNALYLLSAGARKVLRLPLEKR